MASAVANCNLLGAFSRLSLSYAPPQKSASYEVERCSGNLSFPAKQSFHGIIEAAHKKGAGSTKNGRDSIGKRLGVKIFGNQAAKPGSIIIRQRGTKFHPGNNVGLGKDYTIYSLIDGLVQFEKFGPDKKKKVSVYPRTEEVKEKVLDPNSWRAQRIEYFRLRREKRKLRKAGLWPPALVLASAQSNVSGQAEAIG